MSARGLRSRTKNQHVLVHVLPRALGHMDFERAVLRDEYVGDEDALRLRRQVGDSHGSWWLEF